MRIGSPTVPILCSRTSAFLLRGTLPTHSVKQARPGRSAFPRWSPGKPGRHGMSAQHEVDTLCRGLGEEVRAVAEKDAGQTRGRPRRAAVIASTA